ncbi:MAG: hypothetical protein KC619_03930 [Myxococcales bacterium]|nr:hypothetical protein [Myxococcales bacterium]
MDDSARLERRRRALRAARAVTLSLALGAGAAGCSMAHAPEGDAGPDPADSGIVDSGTADAGEVDCTTAEWWDTEVCCELSGGFWQPGGGCAVPGPFVPPDLPA